MKRLAQIVVLLLVAAAVGFWLRPVSYFNGSTYAHEFFAGVRGHTVMVSGYRVHYNSAGPRMGPLSCWCMDWADALKTGAILSPTWPRPVSASICPICPLWAQRKAGRLLLLGPR